MTTQPKIHRSVPAWKGLRTAAIGTGAFADAERWQHLSAGGLRDVAR